ncbi:hypothetical protein ACV33G_29735, partial [Pseudomonas aeruginosa]
MSATASVATRHDWSLAEVRALFEQPFNDLLFQAQTVHRAHFDPNRVQVSTLLSIKTGACPEDCKYCPQSGHYNTGLDKEKLMEVQKVLEAAAEGHAGLQAELLHALDHLQDVGHVLGRRVLPGSAHAEAGRTDGLGLGRRLEDLLHLHQLLLVQAGVVVAGLRA